MKPLFKRNYPTVNPVGNFIKSAVLLIACLCIAKLLILQQSVFFFNYSPFIITSSSMEPEYPAYSLTIVKKVNFNTLEAGDVIAFKSDALGGGLAFHRITKATENGLYTKGDNNNYNDNQLVTENSFVGKAVFCSKAIGHYFNTIRTGSGFLLYILAPAVVVILTSYSIKLVKSE